MNSLCTKKSIWKIPKHIRCYILKKTCFKQNFLHLFWKRLLVKDLERIDIPPIFALFVCCIIFHKMKFYALICYICYICYFLTFSFNFINIFVINIFSHLIFNFCSLVFVSLIFINFCFCSFSVHQNPLF